MDQQQKQQRRQQESNKSTQSITMNKKVVNDVTITNETVNKPQTKQQHQPDELSAEKTTTDSLVTLPEVSASKLVASRIYRRTAKKSPTKSPCSNSSIVFAAIKHPVKEKVVYSESTKSQTKLISILVDEQERETQEKIKQHSSGGEEGVSEGRSPSTEASESFGQTMDWIKEHCNECEQHKAL